MEFGQDEEAARRQAASTASLYAGLDDEKLQALAQKHGHAPHEITELLLAFSVLDLDGSGEISVGELMQVIGYDRKGRRVAPNTRSLTASISSLNPHHRMIHMDVQYALK